MSTIVNLQPLVALLLQFLAALLPILAAWLAGRAAKWLKISSDSQANQLLHDGLDRATSYAVSALTAKFGADTTAIPVDAKNAAVASVVDYALAHLNETITYLGVDPGKLAAIAANKLDVQIGTASTPAPTP